MRHLKTIVVLLLSAAALFGCSTQKAVTNTHTSDSVRVEIRYKEVIKRDTIFVEIPQQSASRETRDTISHLETKYAISDAKIDASGILHHSLESKNVSISVPTEIKTIVKDSIVYRDMNVYVDKVQLVERELTAWQKWQMRSFWILLAIVAAGLVYYFRKPILTLIRRFITFI